MLREAFGTLDHLVELPERGQLQDAVAHVRLAAHYCADSALVVVEGALLDRGLPEQALLLLLEERPVERGAQQLHDVRVLAVREDQYLLIEALQHLLPRLHSILVALEEGEDLDGYLPACRKI